MTDNTPVSDEPPARWSKLFHQGWRFLLLSGLSFGLNIGLTVLAHEVIGLPEEIAYLIALVCVFVSSFFFLRIVVFASRKTPLGTQFISFLKATIGFRICEYLSFLIVHRLLDVNYLVAIIAISIVFTLIKFTFYGKVTFST